MREEFSLYEFALPFSPRARATVRASNGAGGRPSLRRQFGSGLVVASSSLGADS